jgi:hypothetical protein
VHPVALGSGKRIFTGKTGLELIGAKTYRSGVIRARYRPALFRGLVWVEAEVGIEGVTADVGECHGAAGADPGDPAAGHGVAAEGCAGGTS